MVYSPRIDQHTPTIYQIGKMVGKPMTQVAEDLIHYGLENVGKIYLGNGDLASMTTFVAAATSTAPTQILEAMNQVYQKITDRIIALLEKGTIPWKKTWKASDHYPRNLISQKHYQGINVFLLLMSGFSHPYWLTFKQAQELGARIKRGSRGVPVVFWKLYQTEDAESGEPIEIPLLRYYTVFNVSQVENLPERVMPEPDYISQVPPNPIEDAGTIVCRFPNPPQFVRGDSPAYFPVPDIITMPEQEAFSSEENYYATLFHECGHATGHESRLDRRSISEKAASKFLSYSQEELVAEFTASFLCVEAGISPSTIENTAAYIQGWLNRLRNDRKILIHAAGAAQKAADYILRRD